MKKYFSITQIVAGVTLVVSLASPVSALNDTTTDLCANMPGVQTTVPDGVQRDGNICYKTNSSTTTADPQQQTTSPSLLSSFVPEPVSTWLRNLSPVVAETVPFGAAGALAFFSLLPLLQSLREAAFVKKQRKLLEKERGIAEQKDNFIALATHYLRTPLTLMSGSLDTAVELKKVPNSLSQRLTTWLDALSVKLRTVLDAIEHNRALATIDEPSVPSSIRSAWRSAWFLGPAIMFVTFLGLSYFLFVVIGEKNLALTLVIFQAVVSVVAIFVLYLSVRNLYIQRTLSAETRRALEHEAVVDEARNTFIVDTTDALKKDLLPIVSQKKLLEKQLKDEFFFEGLHRLELIMEKFSLLGELRSGSHELTETAFLAHIVHESLVQHEQTIEEKHLNHRVAVPENLTIAQNLTCVRFLVNSLVDNAVKFSREHGQFSVEALTNRTTVQLVVSDNGIGIAAEKLDQLFKPFSRGTSAMEFDYEGMGFGLFLDKIIAHYLDGDISVTSTQGEGTRVSVHIPRRKN